MPGPIFENKRKTLEQIEKEINSPSDEKEDEIFKEFLNDYNEQKENEKENEKIINNIAEEAKIEKIVEENESQEEWYSGISNFFQALFDRGKLRGFSYDKETGKWNKSKEGLKGNETEEIPFREVQEELEKQAQRDAKSNAYSKGVALDNVGRKLINDGVIEFGISTGSLIARLLTGNWDDYSNAQLKGLWNSIKHVGSDVLDTIGDIGMSTAAANMTMSTEQIEKLKKESKVAEQLRDVEYEKEDEELKKEGAKALKERVEKEKARRENGEKLLIDDLYDWSGIEGIKNDIQQGNILRQTISNRAKEIEGRKRISFLTSKDELDESTVEINGENYPKEKPGPDGSENVWDVKKMILDENEKPILNKKNQPMYVDKYTWSEKLRKSNFSAFTDKYYFQDDFAEGLGTALGFVVGGKGINMGVNFAGKTIAKGAGFVSKSLKFEEGALNYLNKTINTTIPKPNPFNENIFQLENIVSKKALNKLSSRLTKATQTIAQSYFMTYGESAQIGRDVQKNITNEQIDKYAKINVGKIADKLAKDKNRKYTSIEMLFLDAQNTADTQREKWAKENPKLFNEILARAIVGKEIATSLNNINVINNLTSAALFVKGTSFSRHILNNPFSRKSILKTLWLLGREGFQEGFLEEGGTNQYAQKAGEAAGNLEMYTFKTFLDKDLKSAENAEQIYAGALLGMMQESGTMLSNLNTNYSEFVKQRRIIKELEEIKSLKTKEQIQEVIRFAITKEDNDYVHKQINSLILQNKPEEAKALVESLLLNQSIRAASSGTSEILNDVFEKMFENENLTAEDKAEVKKAIDFNNMIADAYDAHVQYKNKDGILQNIANKKLIENQIDHILSILPELEYNYNKTLETVVRKKMSTSDNNTNDYNKIKSSTKLDNRHKGVKELKEAKAQLKLLQSIKDNLENEYDYIISDEGQKEYVKQEKEKQIKASIENVNKDNVKETKKRLRKLKALDPETNAKINQKIEKQTIKENSEKKKKKKVSTEKKKINKTNKFKNAIKNTFDNLFKKKKQKETKVETKPKVENSPIVEAPPTIKKPKEDNPKVPEKSKKEQQAFDEASKAAEIFKDTKEDEQPRKGDKPKTHVEIKEDNLLDEKEKPKTPEEKKEPSAETHREKEETFFLPNPNLDASFNESSSRTSFTPGASIYIFRKTGKNKAKFKIHENEDAKTLALQGHDKTIKPVSDELNAINIHATRIITVEEGEAELVDGKWKVTKKAKVWYDSSKDPYTPEKVAPKTGKEISKKESSNKTPEQQAPSQSEDKTKISEEEKEKERKRLEERENYDNAFDLQPIGIDENDSEQQSTINRYSNTIKKINETLRSLLNKDSSLKDIFSFFANALGLDKAEQNFNLFKKAFEQSGIEYDKNFDWNKLYDEYFGETNNEENENNTETKTVEPTTKEIEKQDTKTTSIIEDKTEPSDYTQNNHPVVYKGRKISKPMLKIPFLGVIYEVKRDKFNNIIYVDDPNGKLNTEGSHNLNVILNPDYLVPGKKFNLEIPTDWKTRKVNEYKKDENGLITVEVKTMEQWMKNNNVKEDSEEWINKVPMDMIVDGNNVGPGVHDTHWWNERNTANFKEDTINNEKLDSNQAKNKQQELIKEGQKMTSEIRKSVVKGNKTMVIKEREVGHTLSTSDGKLNSLHDANPEVKIGIYSKEGFIINKTKEGNEYFKGKIINEEAVEDKGHVYMISRIGTEKIDGKLVPTYVAHKIHTNHNQESLQELNKSKRRLYIAADILNKIGDYKNPTQEQVKWAKSVKDQVKSMIGILINDVTIDEENNVMYNGLGKIKQLYALRSNKDSGLILLPQMKDINSQKLPIVHEDGSVSNYKSEAGEGYKGMLMDNLHTQKKFHEIEDSEGNKMRILDIQPKIKFEPVNKNTDTKEKTETKKTKETKNKKIHINKEIKASDTKIKSITKGQRQKVIKHVFHNVLFSLSKTLNNKTGKIKSKDILDRMEKVFDDYLSELKKNEEYKREYEYLLDAKNSILGIGKYSKNINTVKSELAAFFNENLEKEESLNDEGEFVKNHNKASFENDVRTSLSTRLKMFFANIKKPNNKSATEEFANTESYYSLDEIMSGLQDMMIGIPNNPKAFRNKINNQIKVNQDEFGFLKDIIDRFDNSPLRLQKEILHRLNQTKNEMHFVMYSKLKNGIFILQAYDANSRNPKIRKKLEYRENLKQSPLIENYGNTYRIHKDKAQKLIRQYDSWKKKHLIIPNSEYVKWLSNFGIEVSEKTIQDYKDGIVEGHTKFAGVFSKNGGVFGVIRDNLDIALKRQEENKNLVFSYKRNKKTSATFFNIAENNNNNYLKTLINVEVKNTFNIANTMYVGGKTINAYSQPNYSSEQLRKLKDINNPLIEKLKNSAFSKNSLLLKLLENNKVREFLNMSYVSLESLKQQGQKSYKDSEIHDLSPQDYDLLLLGFFQSESSYFNNLESETNGIELRGAKMTFPTLSDATQMFLLNTVVLNLKSAHFDFDGDTISIDERVLDILFDQLVKPDLNRIETYLKSNNNLNVKGLDLGSQLFTIIPALNSLSVELDGTKVKLLSKLHDDIKNGKTAEEAIEKYKSQIYKKLQEIVTENVESKIKVEGDEMSGTWVDNGFVDKNKNTKFLDSKYLRSKGGLDKMNQIRTAAYDFVINNLINQAQIQMLFAGDISNYINDKNGKKFNTDENGKIDVTSPKVEVKENEDQLEKETQVYIDIMKSAAINLSKRLKELISPGNRIAESNGEKYIQVMINDVEESSNTIKSIVQMWYPDIYEENKEDIEKLKKLEEEIRKGNKNGKPVKASEKEHSELLKSLQSKFPKIKDYFEITGTDAQEYTTWQEHLHILLNQGKIEKSLYDSIVAKLESQSSNGIYEGNELNEEEKKVIFQPLKPLYAGLHFNEMTDEEGESLPQSQRFIYIKTSSFPLIPELTQDMQIDKLRKNIEKLQSKTGKKVRVSYQSGNKVGAVKNAMNVNELYSDYSDTLENKINESSAVLDRDNFSIQQDKPFKTDKNVESNKRDEINRGTQFEKVILGNGINKIQEKIFPNKFDKKLLDELNITEKDGNVSGEDLYKIYNHLHIKEQKILRDQLFNSLDLNKNGDWENNIKTSEKIKDALNKRLTNQQDKEIIELSYIVKEEKDGKLIRNYYTKEQIKKLKLKPERAEFNIPIWMSPNSQKFESVLNSIINNKLIHLKFPGFSSPVGSQEGFTYKDESELTDKKGIIFTDKYDGELKATHNEDGSLKSAQVLVASKFKTKFKNPETGKYETKLIDLTKYTKKLKNGRTVLDVNRIDPELLNSFSFRIPTSSHQSGAIIEIVGFLPHSSADLMIVPKDHTTQLGEDYDIDVRYVYSQNYRVDNKGNIKKIDSDYIEERIKRLDKKFENEKEADEEINEILNSFDFIKESEEIQNILKEEGINKEKKLELIKDRLRHLLIENQIMDVYKSVYSSKDPKIQKTISSTLSTDFAEKTANLIDNKIKSKKDDNFTVFDDRHQKEVLNLGASGNLGIGVHSNWVILNSLFQQMKNKPRLINGLEPFVMTIGNFTSFGELGRIKALEQRNKTKGFEPRFLSEINTESQNSSLDNQILQIMGKRNENKHTINVFALLCNLGFDKTIVNGEEHSLPSLFISQPIIRRYVELKNKYESITNDYQSDVDIIITSKLKKEFREGVQFKKDKDGDETVYMTNEQMNAVEKTELTGQKLYESLNKGNNVQQWAVYQKFLELQKHIEDISKIQKASNIDAGGLGISFFNTLAKKDILLHEMNTRDLNVENIQEMFGDREVINAKNEKEINKLIDEGYVKFQEKYGLVTLLKPTTSVNAKIINSIAIGYNLWKNVLPFESEFIERQINEIIINSNLIKNSDSKLNKTSKKTLKLKYKIISDMKDFIYSYSNIGIFDGENVQEERKKLFMDTDENQSLASYLNKLKKDKNKLFNEPFFRELEFVLNKKDESSLIKYTTNDRTNFNKNSVYETLQLFSESKEKLPEFNGDKEYTYEKLIKNLVKYSLLSNQENGAIGFRNHIPIDVLEKYGITKKLKKFADVNNDKSHNLLLNGDFKSLMNSLNVSEINENNTIYTTSSTISNEIIQRHVDRINSKYGESTLVYDKENEKIFINDIDISNFRSVFTKQFFQHNPEIVPRINWKRRSTLINTNEKNVQNLKWFTLKNESDDNIYKSIRDSKNGKFILFEKDANGVFRRINTLGSFGLNEYSPFTQNQESLVKENKFEEKNLITTEPIETNKTEEKIDIKQGVPKILDNIIESKNKFSEAAKLLKPFVKDIPIEVIDLKGLGNGLYVSKREDAETVNTSLGKLKTGTIYISSDRLNNGTNEQISYTLMEEILHSITVDEIDKYVDTRNSYINEKGDIEIKYKAENRPAHINKLVSLFKFASKHILEKYSKDSTLEEAIERLNKQREIFNNKINENTYPGNKESKELKTDIYRTLNLGEFIAGTMLSEGFRDEMNKVEYKSSKKTILSNFANVITRLLKSIAPKAVKNSITEHTFDAVMKLLTDKGKPVSPVSVSKLQESKASKEAKKLLDTKNLNKTKNPNNEIKDLDKETKGKDVKFNLQPLNLHEVTKLKIC